jgi:hypothetical protein
MKTLVWVALFALGASGCDLLNAGDRDGGVDRGLAQPDVGLDSGPAQPDVGVDAPSYTVSAPQLTWAAGQAESSDHKATVRGGPAFHFSDDRYTVRGRLTP